METRNYQEDLQHIRKMMEKSSRFISLSGMAGVYAGVFALVGVGYVFWVFQENGIASLEGPAQIFHEEVLCRMLGAALLVMISAIGVAVYLTVKKSKKNGLQIWDASTKNLLYHFAVPLATGGLFCLALVFYQLYALLAPATLVFYGLALFIAGNYTYSDLKYLGLCEIVLGLAALFFLKYELLFWAVGFGGLHIIYGLIMHKKYQ